MFFTADRALFGAEDTVLCGEIQHTPVISHLAGYTYIAGRLIYPDGRLGPASSRQAYPDGGDCRRLRLLQLVLGIDVDQNLGHVGLQHHSSCTDLLQYVVNPVHMEDQIQLTHVLKAAIQSLHKHLQAGEGRKRGQRGEGRRWRINVYVCAAAVARGSVPG